MPSGNEIITQALRLITFLGVGQTATGPDAVDALAVANRMLASWRIERLMAFSIDRVTGLSLVVAKQSYTVGPGGDWDMVRPVKIERASLHYEPNGSDLEYPFSKPLNETQWQAISDKDTESTIPYLIWYDTDFGSNGRGTCHLWPVPSASAHEVILYVWNPLGTLALATDLAFPPGYEEAILYNLAVRLAPEFGVSANQDIKDLAKQLKGNIKVLNKRTPRLRSDFGGSSRGRYNIRTNQ